MTLSTHRHQIRGHKQYLALPNPVPKDLPSCSSNPLQTQLKQLIKIFRRRQVCLIGAGSEVCMEMDLQGQG